MINKKQYPLFGSLLLLSILSGCASSNTRGPSSIENLNLSGIIEEIGLASKFHQADELTCKNNYDIIYQKLFNLAGETTYLDLNDIKSMDSNIEQSFLARVALRDSFNTFNGNNGCYQSAMDVFKALRYIEDYLVELRMERSQSAPSEYVSLKGEFPYLLINPKYAKNFKSYEDLKSGDVILSRGNTFSSIATVRAKVRDYQFSHLSFVFKESVLATPMTTEAHIEIGSVVEPLLDHINSKNAREVVFRYQDPQVAHKASRHMFNLVSSAQKIGKNIPYDFNMFDKDDSAIHCSEIISQGFNAVLPVEDNSLGSLGSLGSLASPSDLQFDPHFELVAEWRNPRKMEESRMKDFILTKLFEHMDQHGYTFDPSLKMNAESRTYWLLRRLPVVRKFLQNKFSLNQNPGQLELFMAIDKIGDAIYKEIEKSALEYERPMTPKEIFGVVDEFFKQDFETYKRYKKGQDVLKPSFHLLFHP